MLAVPREAATVMLIRDSVDGPQNIEVLMVQRSMESDFCPGVYVFPGGALEATDLTPSMEQLCLGDSADQARRTIRDAGPGSAALGLFVAGIREVFEEVGMLLAYEHDRPLRLEGETEQRFDDYRRRMRTGKLSFHDVVGNEGLTLATDRLCYFAHFITPPTSPIRFSTRFFVARTPEGQRPEHDACETIGCRWISPRAALDGNAKSLFPLIRPTILNLEALSRFNRVQEVLDYTRDHTVMTGMPGARPA